MDLIYCVEDIFGDFLDKNNSTGYNIPDYQRGYKWTKDNVKELLNDIENFEPAKGQFYCLQHITLHTQNGLFNLIDGQQRLTTLYIILSYLGYGDLLKNRLLYSIREDTHRLLDEKIRTGIFWKEKYEPEHKDGYYICEVANAIDDWFSDENMDKETFADKLLHHVKIIVNIPEDVNENKIFNGLNGDRVPLDGTDLVRAILITRAAKEYFINGISNEVTEFRIRMGMEIDNMNSWWRDRDKQLFFRQLISNRASEDDVRVKFSNAMSISLLYRCFFEITSDDPEQGFSFSYFENGHDFNHKKGDDHWEMYDYLQQIHSVLAEWFSNNDIYHWIGYLFFNFKGKNASTSIGDIKITLHNIWKLWEKLASKECFLKELKKVICNLILTYQPENKMDSPEKTLLNKIGNISEDWFSDQSSLSYLLILQDILYASKTKGKLNVQELARDGYGKEDVEHIWCQNPLDISLENKDTIKLWKDALVSKMENIGSNPDKEDTVQTLKDEISDLENILNNGQLGDKDKQRFKEIAGKHGAFSIGNLVLLSESVNREFKNAPYSEKRKVIIQNYFGEGKNKHIRPWTLKVFIKGNGSEDDVFDPWSLRDIKANADAIRTSVSEFIQISK